MNFDYIYTIPVLITFLTLLMGWYNWRFNRNIAFLVAFMLIFVLEHLLLANAIMKGNLPYYHILYYNFSSLYLLKGPLLYFFVRGIPTQNFVFRKKDLLHFIPFVFRTLTIIPYMVTPIEYKIQMSTEILQDIELFKTQNLYSIYPQKFDIILRSVITLGYIVYSIMLCAKRKQEEKNQPFHENSTKIRIWTTIMISIILIISINAISVNFLYQKYTISDLESNLIVIIGYYFNIFLYLLIPLAFFMFPRIVYGVHFDYLFRKTPVQISDKQLTVKLIKGFDLEKLMSEKVEKVDPLYKEDCMKMLEYMSEYKPYLDSKFQMNDFSQGLGMSKHYLQSCINSNLQLNFSLFRSLYRLDHAMRLMKENKNYSLDYISGMSGFASTSSFYSSFKQILGQTPLQWLSKN